MLNERINTVIHKVGMLVRKDQKGQMVLNRSLQSTLRDSYPALVASVVLDTVGCTQAIIWMSPTQETWANFTFPWRKGNLVFCEVQSASLYSF